MHSPSKYLQYWCLRVQKNKKWNSCYMGNKSYQLTNSGQSANHGQIGWHWLAGNSYFPCERIFISSFSEPLGINIEGLNSLLLGIQLFIQIHFDGLCICTNNDSYCIFMVCELDKIALHNIVRWSSKMNKTEKTFSPSCQIRHIETPMLNSIKSWATAQA